MIVDQLGVLTEDVFAAGPRGVLQLEDGFGVEKVILTFATPLVLAAIEEVSMGAFGRVGRVGKNVAFP